VWGWVGGGEARRGWVGGSVGSRGWGGGLVWKGLMLLPAAPARTSGRREVKERKPGKERKTKNISRGPGLPRGGSRIPRVIGIPKSKRITLGDPGYPEGIPRVEGIPT